MSDCDCNDEMENLRDEIAALRAHAARLEGEVERLKGVRPTFAPDEPKGEGLPRYGLRWNGPTIPVSVLLPDGYWTPWHLAESRAARLEERLGVVRGAAGALLRALPEYERHTDEYAALAAALGEE